MSVSPPASDDPLLVGITIACALLAITAFLVWCVVFWVRDRRLRQAKIDAVLEEQLTARVLDRLSGYDSGDDFNGLPAASRRVLLDLLCRLIEQTKGRDRQHLMRLFHEAGFAAQAHSALGSRRAAERQKGAEMLAYVEEKTSTDALRRLLTDADLGVRITATRALLDRDAIDSLATLLTTLGLDENDPPIILSDIFNQLSDRLLPEAIQLLGTKLNPECLRILAISLGRRRPEGCFEAIAALRVKPHPRVRAAAWIGLAHLEDPRAADLVNEGLADPSTDVRLAACRCAAKLGDRNQIAPLAALLTHTDWWLAYEAARALLAIGPAGREQLAKHCEHAAPGEAAWQVWHEQAPVSA